VRSFVLAFLISFSVFAAAPTTDIRVDQAGYPTGLPKVAFVASKTGTTAQKFQLRSAAGDKVVLEGELSAAADDPDSGDKVHAADFSKFDKPGRYYIDVENVGRSWTFSIARDVYTRAYYLAMRSYYGQRCGTAVDMGPEFPGFKHDACHLQGAYHASSGKSGPKQATGGWHDAGDYGRYVVNSGISTGTLLWTWEMFGQRIAKAKLNIPETGKSKVPDILSEIRWNLDWMLSMQDEDGGVWHKQTSERFCAFIMPEKDTFVSYVIGTGKEPYKSSCATADFAAVMAIASRAFRPFDIPYADRTLAAARKAWTWLEKNPNVLFNNPAGVATGGYGDRDCSDERLWAAAELWRTTGEETYNAYFVANYEAQRKTIRAVGPPSWGSVGALGLWSYALGKGKDTTAVNAIREDSLAAAEQIADRAAKHAYRISMTRSDYIWGSNAVAANYGMQLLVANAMKRDPRFVQAAIDNLHYLLGRNTFSLSFVTQVGENAMKHPHHRPSGADASELPWPGLLSGGPNGRPQDPAMRKLGTLPPARMFLDEQESYASNEVAINWNAPLVFLLAGVMGEK
jgi:endoglucanase